MAVPVTAENAPAPAAEASEAPPRQHLRYLPGRGGRTLAWTVMGEGPPVMRVEAPGWDIEAEWDDAIWREQVTDLARHHRLLRYSTLEVGQPGGDSPPVIDFDAMAEDVATVADAAGFDRFALLCESGGVHPGLRFAARHPERVTRLVIVGGYVEGRTRRTGADPETDAFRRMVAEGWRAEAQGLGAAFMLAYLPEGPLEAVLTSARNFQNAVSREAELALRDAINGVDNAALLPLIRCPALVVHARGDGVHPLSEARRMAAGLPDADLLVLEGANHLPVHGHGPWPQYLRSVLDFLGQDADGAAKAPRS